MCTPIHHATMAHTPNVCQHLQQPYFCFHQVIKDTGVNGLSIKQGKQAEDQVLTDRVGESECVMEKRGSERERERERSKRKREG